MLDPNATKYGKEHGSSNASGSAGLIILRPPAGVSSTKFYFLTWIPQSHLEYFSTLTVNVSSRLFENMCYTSI